MRQLIIMRGLPGSGKSTRAREIVEIGLCGPGFKATIRSTDDQFMVNGKYVFNPRMLGVNHAANLRLVEQDMKDEIPCIIVDNTNIKRRDFAPYITLAKKYGYDVREEVIAERNVDTCFERNSHNVPREAIQRMADNFED